MAKKRIRRASGGYKFTPSRRAQLRRAQAISARKRKGHGIKTGLAVVGGVATIGTAAYLGHRYGGQAVSSVRGYKPKIANARNKMSARLAVQPAAKESTRIATKTMIAKPSPEQINEIREKAGAKRPDPRIYDEDLNIDSEAMVKRSAGATNRSKEAKDARRKEASARRRLEKDRKYRAEVLGKPVESLSGTPGGGLKPAKARKPREAVDPIEGLKLHKADASIRILNGARIAGWDGMSADNRNVVTTAYGLAGYGIGQKAGWIFTPKVKV